jgi:hypothetical protein
VTPKLPDQRHGFSFNFTSSSLRIDSTHINLAGALAKALYSVLVLDLDTIACFLALQETRFSPTNMANPLVDRSSEVVTYATLPRVSRAAAFVTVFKYQTVRLYLFGIIHSFLCVCLCPNLQFNLIVN